MKAYAEYKPSGVEWLGDVPSHWEIYPIRNIFKFRNEKNDPVKTENILSLSIANGVTEYTEENRGGNKRKEDLTAYKLAYPNDIVLNSMNVIVGAVGRSNFFGAISPVYYALYLYRNDDIRFYEYVFSNSAFQRGLLQYGKGILIKKSDSGKLNTIRMKISQDDLKMLYFPRPPLSEQQKIADYLDRQTARIDTLIAEQNRLIELLAEQRKAVISHAVTRGINPNATMKKSGVEWLGDVPSHWEFCQLRRFARINNGSDYKEFETIEGYPVYGSGGQFAYSSKYIYDGEAILFGRKGTIDKPLYVNEKFWTVDTMFYCICNKRVVAKFIYYQSLGMPFIQFSTSTALPSMTQSVLLDFKFAIPPLSEQNEIVAYLDQKTAQIDALIAEQNRLIDRLTQYRASLISAAVTGKIMV